MKILIVAIASLLMVGCSKPEGVKMYRDNIVKIGLGGVAKQYCTCRFVIGRDKDFCHEFAAIRQIKPQIREKTRPGIDGHEAIQVIETSFLFLFYSEAWFSEELGGCQLQPVKMLWDK